LDGGGGVAAEPAESTTGVVLRGMLALENDGSKFFDALGHMGSEALTLSAEDVAGGLKESAKHFADKGKANWAFVKDAAAKVDVKSGWAPFAASATTDDSKALLVKAPAGVAFAMLAAFLYVCFSAFFFTTKYGPTALQVIKDKGHTAAGVIATGAGNLNANAIAPIKAKLRPLIIDAKAKLDQVDTHHATMTCHGMLMLGGGSRFRGIREVNGCGISS
jgi:hypothetical protein